MKKLLFVILLLSCLASNGQTFSLGFHAGQIMEATQLPCTIHLDETDAGVKFLYRDCEDISIGFILSEEMICVMAIVWPDNPAMDIVFRQTLAETWTKISDSEWAKVRDGKMYSIKRKKEDDGKTRYVVTMD